MRLALILVLAVGCATTTTTTTRLGWTEIETGGVTLRYTEADEATAATLQPMVRAGKARIEAFFGASFPSPFAVRIFPSRDALDAYWQRAWGEPTFTSECWMVASGSATELVILSPLVWAAEACEHDAADTPRVKALVAHELVHVFQAQHLPNRKFDGMEAVGWFVEGLATYVSGQLELGYLAPATEAVAQGKAPTALAHAWSGKYRYGVCGSLVRFVDQRVGRAQLFAMLSLHNQADLLAAIGLSEAELLAAWKTCVGLPQGP